MDKILFLGHSGKKGGAEYCLDIILRNIDLTRYEPGVIFSGDGPMVATAQKRGIWYQIRPLNWWMLYEPCLWEWKNRLVSPYRIYKLVQQIRRNDIKLVYSNTACIFEGAVAARIAGVPHIWHVHEVLNKQYMKPRYLPLSFIAKTINRLSDRVIFESEASREVASQWIPLEKSVAIPNSVRFTDTEGYESGFCRMKYGIRPNEIVILWAGRFSDRKNPFALIDALEKMKFTENVRVLFVGDGKISFKNALQDAIQSRNMDSWVQILPFQENIRSVLACADILTLTSVEESFGLVLVEAGTFKIPVVATKSQGPNEIIVDGKTGFLVRQNDPEHLAQKLDRLVSDWQLRFRLGKANHRRVMEEYNPVTNTKKIEMEIDKALAARKSEQKTE